MKIFIRIGHTLSGQDAGANGIKSEVSINREYGKLLADYLKKEGHEVYTFILDSSTSMGESLSQGVNLANNGKYDLFISCHVNAFNTQAYGSEVVYSNGSVKGKDLAERVVNSIASKCGFYNRGAKADIRGLYELKATNMPAIIVEPLFCDNANDIAKYNADKLAKAIAEGILNKSINSLNNSQPVQPQPQPQLTKEQELNNFAWELAQRKIISDSDKWIKNGLNNEDVYWLMKKTVAFLQSKNV